jgi:hypothetical protein
VVLVLVMLLLMGGLLVPWRLPLLVARLRRTGGAGRHGRRFLVHHMSLRALGWIGVPMRHCCVCGDRVRVHGRRLA